MRFFLGKFGKSIQKIIMSNCIAHVSIVYVLVFVVVFCKKMKKEVHHIFANVFVYFLNLAGLYFNNSKNCIF